MRKAILLFLAAVLALLQNAGQLNAQSPGTFMAQAVDLARQVQRETGVPSSVILAQAILETGWGRQPVPASNNYFGIKAAARPDGTIAYGNIASGWTTATTKEWDGSRYVDQREQFRVYRTMGDSFLDLGHLYLENARYAAAMQQIENPRQFATRVAQAGFATAPDYADRLIQLMDEANLYQYDLKRDDAEFLDQSDYPTVRPGQPFEIYFEVRNSGFSTWRQNEGYYLADGNDDLFGPNRPYTLEVDVAPQATVRWTIQLVAPSHVGAFRTQWRLHHGDIPFGPEMYIDITVARQNPDMDQVGKALALVSLLLTAAAGVLWFVRKRHPPLR